LNLALRARLRHRTVALLVAATLVGSCVGACSAFIGTPSPSQSAPSASPSAAAASIAPDIAPSPTSSSTPSTVPAAQLSYVVAATSCDAGVVPGASFPPPAKSTPAPRAKPLTLHVPIIEYHRIVPLTEAGRSLPGLTMPPEVFNAQMDALHTAGWHTITLATLADDLWAGVTPPSHSFVVTIDDGWWDSYAYAYPILARHGYVATFFVIADRIGQSGFMGTGQIQALAEAGNEIGDHTVHHDVLPALQPKALTYEIDSGAATIAAVTGRWPETLAYPSGKVDAQVIAAAAACKSLRMGVAEGNGGPETWVNRYRISRVEVAPDRMPADLLAQVQHAGR
jgi:peptidoglycan/xylan/chitin deacetylase (PgdA/CDA1 family)